MFSMIQKNLFQLASHVVILYVKHVYKNYILINGDIIISKSNVKSVDKLLSQNIIHLVLKENLVRTKKC